LLREHRRIALLMTCGLVSSGVYWFAFAAPYSLRRLAPLGAPADIGLLTDYSPRACALYVGALLALFAVYLAAVYLGQGISRRSACAIVIGLGVVAAGVLCLAYPYAASDVFLYIARGRVLGIYGQNSLLVPPDRFPLDGYVPFTNEWTGMASPYGPLWEWVAAGLARLGDGSLLRSLLVFKGFSLLTYVGCCGLVLAILRQTQSPHPLSGLIAFAWNPLILIETHANAHNDLFMVSFVLLAIWLWTRSDYRWMFVALTAGGLVKYAPFLLLPIALVLLRQRLTGRDWLREALMGGGISALLAVALFASLWPGWDNSYLLGQMERIHTSVCVLLIYLLHSWRTDIDGFSIAAWVMRVGLVVAYLVGLARSWIKRLALTDAFALALYAWLIFGAVSFGYWYIAWLVALCPLLERREMRWRITAFSFCGILSVAIYTFGGAWTGFDFDTIHRIAIPVVFALPFLLAWGLHLAYSRTRPIPDPRA
jgi:alpha-1,6-mannosyltransferase